MINHPGHFTCYEKRTFSLANDNALVEGERISAAPVPRFYGPGIARTQMTGQKKAISQEPDIESQFSRRYAVPSRFSFLFMMNCCHTRT